MWIEGKGGGDGVGGRKCMAFLIGLAWTRTFGRWWWCFWGWGIV